MIVEVHILQNLAPSNINRDDQGQPKEAMFGGYRRARVSSQSWKRAVREAFENADLVSEDQRAVRTRQLMFNKDHGLAARFKAAGKDAELSLNVAKALLSGLGFAPDSKSPEDAPRTQYLLFLGQQEIDGLVQVALDNWDELAGAVEKAVAGSKKKDLKATVPEDVQRATLAVLDGGRAVDLALFGRMLADLPDKNVDGATQVAHAISTHAVDIEWDFFTAVDDLNLKEDTGAGMMGMVDFDSSTLYRYTNIDMEQLAENLGGDSELAANALKAYLRAFMCSIPTGKQNSFAAQNLPAFAFAVVRDAGRWSLANAFVNPVEKGKGDILGKSILELLKHWTEMTDMYGADGITALHAVALGDYAKSLHGTQITSETSVDGWISAVVAAQEASHEQR
ncbi:MAG: type I-E CRISPR-associated protein Cas7/Cse4/CasC [Thermomicrobiales bacterium]|nr:type I-E CRISPR-associated protein Cas7/Cse4/CasC [Thermomicrobiales bacterium]